MTHTFSDLGLSAKVIAALLIQDITEPTPVQAAVIPDAIAGHDVLGRAQTGSGKTLAFGIPVAARLSGEKSRMHRPRAIIIVPTRELATQVQRSLEPVATAMKLRLATVYGGSPYDRQIKALRQGVDIVVATPGRLGDLIQRGHLRTDDVQVTVLDEADHLCDLGFFPVVDELLSQTPADAQRLLLSATLDGDVDKLVRKHLRDPKLHQLDPPAGSVVTMEHHVMVVGGFQDKVDAVSLLVEANPRSIVFTRTREGATELRDAFAERGIVAVDLHGNLSQRVRERNLYKFKKGDAQVVVATDVAARGIHVDGIGLVVHFDAPTDPKAYLHRSGRTARAGESGAVMTLTVRKRLDEVRRLQKQAGVEAKHHDIRSAPRPMTAEALAAAEGAIFESEAPRRTAAPRKPYGSRPRGQGGGYGQRRLDRAPRDGARPERSDRTPRSDRSARDDRTERPQRTDRPQRAEWTDRPQRTERPQRAERTERTDRGERREWGNDRSEHRRTAPSRFEGQKKFEAKHGDKPAAKKPAAKGGDRPTGKPKVGKKARWTGAEKRTR